MKVSELIELLKKEDQDASVGIHDQGALPMGPLDVESVCMSDFFGEKYVMLSY